MISGIRAILVANSTVTTALGHAGQVNKIFPVVVDEGVEAPYIALSLFSNTSEAIKNASDRTGYPVVNINVHADDYDEIESLETILRNALNGQTGLHSGTTFQKIWCSNSFDRPDLYSPERPRYARSIQFSTIIKR
jgi:hypothetical protein